MAQTKYQTYNFKIIYRTFFCRMGLHHNLSLQTSLIILYGLIRSCGSLRGVRIMSTKVLWHILSWYYLIGTSKFHWRKVLAIKLCFRIFSVWPQGPRPYLSIGHIPMGGQFFKFRIFQFWLQIRIPLKKVSTQTIFTFPKFWWEHSQNYKKQAKSRVSLTYPLFS